MVKKENGVISICGRINSQNAKEFEQKLLEYKDDDKVVIDASKLENISSAGLRGLLALKNRCGRLLLSMSNLLYMIFLI